MVEAQVSRSRLEVVIATGVASLTEPDERNAGTASGVGGSACALGAIAEAALVVDGQAASSPKALVPVNVPAHE
jgi:hypothetical protein